jgi:5-methylcytosine-specific restriction endonuclease McrA
MPASYSTKRREYQRAYRATWRQDPINAQKNRATSAEWRDKHPGLNRLYSQRWRDEHPERARESDRKKRAKQPEKILTRNRNRKARIRALPGQHTASEVAQLFIIQRGNCAGCQVALVKSGKGKYHVDHVVPLARGGSNGPENLQLLCKKCNLKKAAMDPYEWANLHGLLFI